MARKLIFPITVNDKTFNNVAELHKFYYEVEPACLENFSKHFWKEGINLTELVHFPERFTLINNLM